MSLLDSLTLARDQTFRNRVRSAAVKSAIAVTSESNATDNHSRRVNLAVQILMSPEAWGDRIAEGVATNPSIAQQAATPEAIPDGDIEFTVNTLFDAYAGRG